MNQIIQVKNLKKSYGKLEAVKGIDFYVETGKLFAFLGPNGAGKSTTIDILCTLMKQDSGTVIIDGCVLGKDDNSIRNKIGVVFQDSVLDPMLTVRENLEIRAGFYKMKKQEIKHAVRTAAIAADAIEFLDRPYGKLSGGQRRRADIARALVNTPKILFLDEPTTGLDPKTKEGVWEMITQLQKKNGMTIFLTTHYMEEAATADFIVIMNQGRIAAKGTPYNLQERYSSDRIRLKPKDAEELTGLFQKREVSYEERNGILTVGIADSMEALSILNTYQPYIESFEVIHGSMEDVFLNIIGGNINA